MSSCERPRKSSARDAFPSSLSNWYCLSIRTQGSSCRRFASSSLRRVCSFSALSKSSRAASHSSRVPVLCLVIFFSFHMLSSVFVLVAHPILRSARFFITAFGGQVEEIVGGIHQVNAARVGRVGVIDVAVLVAEKRADALQFINFHFDFAVVVGKHRAFDLLRRERHVEIKIKIGIKRGNPFELPAHALLEWFNFFQWRAGNDGESRIALSNMNVRAVVVVGPK